MHGICLASSEARLLWLSSYTGNNMSVLLVTGLGNRIKHSGFITGPQKPQMAQTGQTLRTTRKHDAWQVW